MLSDTHKETHKTDDAAAGVSCPIVLLPLTACQLFAAPAEGGLAIETKHGRGYYSEGVTSPERLNAEQFTVGPREHEFASSPTHALISPRKEAKPESQEGLEGAEDADEGAAEQEVDTFNEGDPYEAMFAHLDYSKRSVEPKVNYISGRAGDPPRKVEIERKKREYEAKDLRALLLERGVSPVLNLHSVSHCT